MYLVSDVWDLSSSNRNIRKKITSTVINMNMSLNKNPNKNVFQIIYSIFKHLLKFSKVQEIFNSIVL